jgi:hypothetical protein
LPSANGRSTRHRTDFTPVRVTAGEILLKV